MGLRFEYKKTCGRCKIEIDKADEPGVWERNPHCEICESHFNKLPERWLLQDTGEGFELSTVEPKTNCWYYELGELRYDGQCWGVVVTRENYPECFAKLKEKVTEKAEIEYYNAMKVLGIAKCLYIWNTKNNNLMDEPCDDEEEE
jgi:hypothetical protein